MDFKKIGKRLLFVPPWLIVLLVVISAVTLVWVFVGGHEKEPVAYALYLLAFYTVSVLTVWCVLVLPKTYRAVKTKIYENPLGKRYMTDAVFRTNISLHVSLGVNLLYGGLNVLLFVWYRSMWFIVLAVYYMILAVMRFFLVRYVRRTGIGRNRLGELVSARFCSCILLSVNFALSGAVLMILYEDKGFSYPGIVIYVVALYTFYITVHAIRGLIVYRKYKSPVMTIAKTISFCAALVSMLSLETAMFSQFGQDMKPADQRLMVALTGAGVSVAVITMSIYMIVRSVREIREQRSNESDDAA